MRYVALACDYDGTLAHDGRVDDETVLALECLRESGRRLILVTGRQLDDLATVFTRFELFDRIVAENGALLYQPQTHEERRLAEPPPSTFAVALRARGVRPLSVGRVIVATVSPHETTVVDVIRELGLELQVIFNKGSVMVLPSGTNKATGLTAALAELGLSARNTVGVGDAENDHAFLSLCECAVAVANALPGLKEHADLVTAGARGAGVVELIQAMIASDLAELAPRLGRHRILLGTCADGAPFSLEPSGPSVLLAGSSGSGKSTLVTGFLERLADGGYQSCVVDPEGDYESFAGAVVLGARERPPAMAEVATLLERPDQNVVVNLVGVPLDERPAFCTSLLPRFAELRALCGRPHWIVIDEAHHLFPAWWRPAATALPPGLDGVLFVALHPQHLAGAALASIPLVIGVGEGAQSTVRDFAAARRTAPPALPDGPLERGEALAWRVGEPVVLRFTLASARAQHRRHRRKYAQGTLGEDASFYFRGPDGQLNLRAQNLMLFMQLADGVDDATWSHHLRRGDYSTWFRSAIKDEALADETARIEAADGLPPIDSRARVRAAIEKRYTLSE